MKRLILCMVCCILTVGCDSSFLEKPVSDVAAVTDTEVTSENSQEYREESKPHVSPDTNCSSEESVVFSDGTVREIKVEIYEEESQTLVTDFELTDQTICAKIFAAFDKCFAEVCEKYPHDAAPDKDTKTDYRVAIYLNTYSDSTKENLACYIDISYPYGYTNDIYRLMHHGGSPFGESKARLGKPFIDMIDEYVKEYFANN